MTIIAWLLPFRLYLMTSHLSGSEMTGMLMSFSSAGGCEFGTNILHCNRVPLSYLLM